MDAFLHQLKRGLTIVGLGLCVCVEGAVICTSVSVDFYIEVDGYVLVKGLFVCVFLCLWHACVK